MGQVPSQEENKVYASNGKFEKFSKDRKINKNESIVEKDNYSSYRGVKTDTLTDKNSNKEKTISNDTTSVTAQEKNDLSENKISTLFEWKEGGNVVYIAGSFSNWTQWFLMTKNSMTNNFDLILDLPRGVHHYKFIVDNKWVFSKQYPTCKDNKGNINNVIDTTKIVFAKKQAEPEIKKSDNLPVEDLKKNLTEIYSEYYPSKNEMNLDAPNAPTHYAFPYNIDRHTNQETFGNSIYLEHYDRNNYCENNSYKSISIPAHVNLNHITTNCNYIKQNHNLITSSVQRIKNKFLTIIYYQPLN